MDILRLTKKQIAATYDAMCDASIAARDPVIHDCKRVDGICLGNLASLTRGDIFHPVEKRIAYQELKEILKTGKIPEKYHDRITRVKEDAIKGCCMSCKLWTPKGVCPTRNLACLKYFCCELSFYNELLNPDIKDEVKYGPSWVVINSVLGRCLDNMQELVHDITKQKWLIPEFGEHYFVTREKYIDDIFDTYTSAVRVTTGTQKHKRLNKLKRLVLQFEEGVINASKLKK